MCLLVLASLWLAGCGTGVQLQTASVPETTPMASEATSNSSLATVAPSLTPGPDQIQLDLLARSALDYLAGDEVTAFEVAHALNYSPGYGRPQDMCGPLAFKILQDAGIVSKYIDLRDYWLLYPPDDAYLLERVFPPEDFEWLTIRQPIDQIDYEHFPLLAGDLLYIYSGEQGDYSHVLVVTRVDDAGRAYSVTNNYTVDGFVIQEYMLYDPAAPGVGIFYEWSDPANRELGLTGFGGFDLWRPKSLPYHADLGDTTLASEVDALLEGGGGKWYVRFENVSGEVLYSRLANYRLNGEFVTRLPVAVLLLKALEGSGISPVGRYIEENTLNGLSYGFLLQAMLAGSDPDAGALLKASLSQLGMDVPGTLREWGLANTFLSEDTTSAEDLVSLMGGVTRGDVVGQESARILLDLMVNSTQNGSLRSFAPPDYQVYGMHQQLVGTYPEVNLLAILAGQHTTYLLAVFGIQSVQEPIDSTSQSRVLDGVLDIFQEFMLKDQ